MTQDFQLQLLGYTVSATLYEPKQPKNHILLSLIGYSSNKARYSDFLSTFANELGMTSLVFDYSGHGESPFKLSEISPAEHFIEVVTAFDWLKQHHPDHKITVMGSSYGGFMATQLTNYRKFDNLILRAPAIYPPIKFYTKWLELDKENHQSEFRHDKEALAKHPLLTHVSNFAGNTLVMVHENDEAVPKETTDAFIKAFDADSHLAKDFPHGLVDVSKQKQETYKQVILGWLSKHSK